MTEFEPATIRPATQADLPTILALLAESGLPADGLAEHLGTALVACRGSSVVGSAALELWGHSALLRSVAVQETWRGKGLGRQLAQAALDLARQQQVDRVYLLTETAEQYFRRFGFQQVERAHVDLAIQQSIEFTSACPVSAQVMVLALSEHQ
jgi:amino-acid N-acetyltransferase